MTSWATLPVVADLHDPVALGVDHQLAPARVEVARGLLVAGAEALPGGVVASQHPVADLLADAVRVVLLELVELGEPGLPRLVQQVGPGQGVGRRVG